VAVRNFGDQSGDRRTLRVPKCHPCRSSDLVVFVEDAETALSADGDSEDLDWTAIGGGNGCSGRAVHGDVCIQRSMMAFILSIWIPLNTKFETTRHCPP